MSSDPACDILIVWIYFEHFEFEEQCRDRFSKDIFLLGTNWKMPNIITSSATLLEAEQSVCTA